MPRSLDFTGFVAIWVCVLLGLLEGIRAGSSPKNQGVPVGDIVHLFGWLVNPVRRKNSKKGIQYFDLINHFLLDINQ